MSKIRKVAGTKVRELDKPVEMKIITKVPAKWLLKDMETGQTYIGTGMILDFFIFYYLCTYEK